MRKTLFLLLLVEVFCAMPAAAQQQLVAGGMVRGTVEAVYVRIAPGLFVETRIYRVAAPSTETWSDIRVLQTSEEKPRNELAKNPEGLTPNQGDVVQLVIPPSPELATGPTPEVTRVVQRVAPAQSLYARRFHADNPLVTIATRTTE